MICLLIWLVLRTLFTLVCLLLGCGVCCVFCLEVTCLGGLRLVSWIDVLGVSPCVYFGFGFGVVSIVVATCLFISLN